MGCSRSGVSRCDGITDYRTTPYLRMSVSAGQRCTLTMAVLARFSSTELVGPMNSDSIKIRFGELDDVIGPARRHEDISIVPARVQLNGSMLTNGRHFDEYLAAHKLPLDVKALIRPGEDAPWVCGRVQRVFSLPQLPEEERAEKSCMGFGFLAALQENGQLIGIPFECTDYYGRSLLVFSGDSPPQSLIDRITNSFWQLMLEAPQDLPEYSDQYYHTGAGVEVRFGVRDGEPFMEEVAD